MESHLWISVINNAIYPVVINYYLTHNWYQRLCFTSYLRNGLNVREESAMYPYALYTLLTNGIKDFVNTSHFSNHVKDREVITILVCCPIYLNQKTDYIVLHISVL